MNHKDFNAVRLDRVTDKQWREALDELTVYLIRGGRGSRRV